MKKKLVFLFDKQTDRIWGCEPEEGKLWRCHECRNGCGVIGDNDSTAFIRDVPRDNEALQATM